MQEEQEQKAQAAESKASSKKTAKSSSSQNDDPRRYPSKDRIGGLGKLHVVHRHLQTAEEYSILIQLPCANHQLQRFFRSPSFNRHGTIAVA